MILHMYVNQNILSPKFKEIVSREFHKGRFTFANSTLSLYLTFKGVTNKRTKLLYPSNSALYSGGILVLGYI